MKKYNMFIVSVLSVLACSILCSVFFGFMSSSSNTDMIISKELNVNGEYELKSMSGSSIYYKSESIQMYYDDDYVYRMKQTVTYDVEEYINELDISDEEKELLRTADDKEEQVESMIKKQDFNYDKLSGIKVSYDFKDNKKQFVITRLFFFDDCNLSRLKEKGIIYIDAESKDNKYPKLDDMISFYKLLGYNLS